MQTIELRPDGYFCVRFVLDSNERFAMLKNVFEALRNGKTAEFTDADDPYWRTFFDEQALASFWWPTAEELADWQRRWESTPSDKRQNDPTLETPWGFTSMIDAFYNGEYDLIDLERLPNGTGQLLFDPHAFPFGGTGCMRALIESFGGEVTGESMP